MRNYAYFQLLSVTFRKVTLRWKELYKKADILKSEGNVPNVSDLKDLWKKTR